MVRQIRRIGIALGSFVAAFLVVSVIARIVFGSGNVLVWVVAIALGALIYADIIRRDRKAPRVIDSRATPPSGGASAPSDSNVAR